MRLRKYSTIGLLLGALSMSLFSCKKNEHLEELVKTPEAVRFNVAVHSATYFINTTTGLTYKIPLSISTPSTEDRVVSFTYSSPTGAAKGAQYNAPDQITIPAGKLLDTLTINGLFDGYATPNRKDTLLIKITGPDTLNNKGNFRLIMQKVCPTVLNDLLGDYDNTREVFGTSAYGPYTTTITSATALTATTGEIVVANIYDFGWNPIKFKLDWTVPTATTVTLAAQDGVGPGSTLGYPGESVSVRPFAGQVGTVNMCNQTITLRLQIGVQDVGWFGSLYTVNMAR